MRWLLFLALPLATVLTSVVRADCSTTLKQLTWECNGLCDDYIPCVVHDTSEGFDCDDCHEDDSGECQYQCLLDAYYDGNFRYFIPYGQAALEDPAVAEYESDASDGESFPSNDNLTSISGMQVNPNVSTVHFWAGSKVDNILAGTFVQVELASPLLPDETNVTEMIMYGMDLHPYEHILHTKIPRTVKILKLVNGNLSSFSFSANDTFPNVKTLDLSTNNIGALNITHSVIGHMYIQNNRISTFQVDAPELRYVDLADNDLKTLASEFPKLVELNLSKNHLAEFDVWAPQLTTLDLSYNNLTSIPTRIYDYKSLGTLYLKGNQLKTPTFTSTQVDFLASIALDIENSDFDEQPDCDQPRDVSGKLSVCIVDEHYIALIVGVAAGTAVFLIGAVIWHRRRHRTSHIETNDTEGGHLAFATPTAAAHGSLWSDAELCNLRVNPNDIHDIKKIGNGSFGVVWLVRYQNSELLASKRLVDTGKKNDMEKHARLGKFMSEIKLVATLEHPQIVRFVGVAWKYYDDLQALFEYMELGDLREYLISTAATSARSWDVPKLRVALDVVEALVYVHSLTPSVVHRDLKSHNVLLTEKEHDLRGKLTDFGTARSQSTQATMTAGIGTGRWIAPEVLKGNPDYGTAADIYSFGVLLSELDTHSIPYDDVEDRVMKSGGNVLSNVALLQMVASGALRPSFRPECPVIIKDLAKLCLSQKPSDRPTAAEVHYELRSIRRSLFGC